MTNGHSNSCFDHKVLQKLVGYLGVAFSTGHVAFFAYILMRIGTIKFIPILIFCKFFADSWRFNWFLSKFNICFKEIRNEFRLQRKRCLVVIRNESIPNSAINSLLFLVERCAFFSLWCCGCHFMALWCLWRGYCEWFVLFIYIFGTNDYFNNV